MATRVVAALVLFVVSGCTATATSERAAATPMRSVSSTMSSPGIPTLPCTDPVDALNSMGARGVPILDAVAIGVQAAPVTFYADPDGGLGFGKVWLWIRANYPATLTLPRGAGAEMRWSNTEDKPQGRTFRAPVCRAGDATWTAYPGGFLLPRPACLPLTVSADGHTTTVTIAIGRPCLHPPDAISGLALAKATTPTIRRKLIAVPARIATSARRATLHLPTAWPWETAWTQLFTRVCGPPAAATT